jgi:hypothetical protein
MFSAKRCCFAYGQSGKSPGSSACGWPMSKASIASSLIRARETRKYSTSSCTATAASDLQSGILEMLKAIRCPPRSSW